MSGIIRELVPEESAESTPPALPGTQPEGGLAFTPPPPPGLADKIDLLFIGPDGVRWFWRLLAYFAMRQVLYWILGDAVLYAQEASVSFLWVMFIAESVYMVAAITPSV